MLFVDTSAFYALADRGDRHHEAAKQLYEEALERLVDRRLTLVTSDHVFVESWCLLRARLGRGAARQLWEALRRGVVGLLGVADLDLDRAWHIAESHGDQGLSLVDCTSFALLERHGIHDVFTFDQHFSWYRYGAGKSRWFNVLPGPAAPRSTR